MGSSTLQDVKLLPSKDSMEGESQQKQENEEFSGLISNQLGDMFKQTISK